MKTVVRDWYVNKNTSTITINYKLHACLLHRKLTLTNCCMFRQSKRWKTTCQTRRSSLPSLYTTHTNTRLCQTLNPNESKIYDQG